MAVNTNLFDLTGKVALLTGASADLKGVAVFLASPTSAYATGQAIAVCGGARMWR